MMLFKLILSYIFVLIIIYFCNNKIMDLLGNNQALIKFIELTLPLTIPALLYFFQVNKDKQERLEKEKQKEEDTLKVGISIYQSDDTYVNLLTKKIERQLKACEKQQGIKIHCKIVSAENDQNEQNEQVEHFAALAYDVICVNAVDRTNVSTMIDRAEESEIPLIFFNRQPVQDDLRKGQHIYYVGSDAQESGRLQGELVASVYRKDPAVLDKNGDGVVGYAVLEGETGHQDAIIRSEWSVKTMTSSGVPAKRITGGVANWMKEQAAAIVGRWLKEEEGELELILCNNDDMALGAIETLRQEGRTDISVVGIDGTEEGLMAVRDGKMLGTVKADSDIYAEYIARMVCGLKKEGTVPKGILEGHDREVWIPWEIKICPELGE